MQSAEIPSIAPFVRSSCFAHRSACYGMYTRELLCEAFPPRCAKKSGASSQGSAGQTLKSSKVRGKKQHTRPPVNQVFWLSPSGWSFPTVCHTCEDRGLRLELMSGWSVPVTYWKGSNSAARSGTFIPRQCNSFQHHDTIDDFENHGL